MLSEARTIALTAALLGCAALTARAQEDSDDGAAAAIRAATAGYVHALETGDLAQLPPLADDFTAVTALGERVDRDGLEAALNRERSLSGEGGRFAADVEADATEWRITSAGDGVCWGVGVTRERYEFAGGGGYELRVAWTVVARRAEAGWRIVRLHRSIDPVDNPINLASGQRIALLFGTIGAGVGALFGWAVVSYRRRTARPR